MYFALRNVQALAHLTDKAIARRAAEEMATWCGYTDEVAAEVFADAIQDHIEESIGVGGTFVQSLVE